MKKGKVLVIGSGGREHALGWKLGKSDEVKEVIYAPGNAGTQEDKGRNVAIDSTKKENFEAVKDFIQAGNIDMTVVGPEQPLADGLVDYLHTHGHKRVFGPSKKAAQLESDKFFSYNLMEELNIPQADSIMCYETVEALDAIGEIGNKYANGVVIKARGLTGGKGVTVCDNANEAISEIQNHSKSYGPEVLIAQRLYGQEFSVFGISDGESVSPLEIALQDHKPLLEEDEGPNTGGMGAYGPAPIASTEVVRNVAENMMTPVVQLMKKKGNEYKGFMYAGCMMTQEGPKIIEFNIRFGDPECQPAMMMIKNGLYQPLSLALEGKLDEINIEFNQGGANCVVLASQGYPGDYEKGLPITGIDDANSLPGVKVFHAGTKKDNKDIVTAGGRVLGVTAYSKHGIQAAQTQSYKAVSAINIPNGFAYRLDIGDKGIT